MVNGIKSSAQIQQDKQYALTFMPLKQMEKVPFIKLLVGQQPEPVFYASVPVTVVRHIPSDEKWLAWNMLTLKVLVMTIDAQWEGMGDVGSARYEPALLPPCPTIRVLSYSNL